MVVQSLAQAPPSSEIHNPLRKRGSTLFYTHLYVDDRLLDVSIPLSVTQS